MSPLKAILGASLILAATSASATSLVILLDATGKAIKGTSDATSDVSSSSSGNNKIVKMAKDDATSFIATDGRIRGAFLERALNYVRENNPSLVSTDFQIAEAIVAFNSH
jgi:uncharacterized protein (TIGR02448 family)